MRKYLTEGMVGLDALFVHAGFVFMLFHNDLLPLEVIVGSQVTVPGRLKADSTAMKYFRYGKDCTITDVNDTRYREVDKENGEGVFGQWTKERGLIRTLPPAAAPAAPADPLSLDIDQFWFPRCSLARLGRHVEDCLWEVREQGAERGFFERFPFYELPPVSATYTPALKLPAYLGYMMTPFTAGYYINHCEGLGAANVELRDLWDTNQRPLLRNRAMQTEAKVDPGQQFLTSYNDLGRIGDGAKLAPDVKEVSDAETEDYGEDPRNAEETEDLPEEKSKTKKKDKKKAKKKKKTKRKEPVVEDEEVGKEPVVEDEEVDEEPAQEVLFLAGEDEDEEVDKEPAPEAEENAKAKKNAKKRERAQPDASSSRIRVQRKAAKTASEAISRHVAQETN
jgi:outer membrane biosynthesis protein TonB